MSTDFAHYRRLAESVYRNRPWIVAMDVLVPAAAQAQALLDLGASRVLAIGASRGMGDLPDPAGLPQIAMDVQGEDIMSSIRASQDALASVPSEVRAAIDELDPDGDARVVTAHYGDGRPVGGRLVYGARPAAWRNLEDKTTIDALWRRAGVPHEEVLVVKAELAELRRARAHFAGDLVLSGDCRDGFNGAAEYVRWIRSEEHLERAADFFEARCDAVRAMPFLEGVACSIHGMVFEDHVAALRPCEMIVMRDPGAGRFVYASVATFWEPAEALAEEMRAVARRVGEALREDYGYRGTFTVDGVSTPRGFRPTELNPRYGAGMMSLSRGLDACPLYLLNLALMAGEDLDWRPRELERLIRAHAAAHPCGGGAHHFGKAISEEVEGGLLFAAEGLQLVQAGEPADATFCIGPGVTGGRCRVTLDPERVPSGPAATPLVARALSFLGEHYDLELPPMEVGADQH